MYVWHSCDVVERWWSIPVTSHTEFMDETCVKCLLMTNHAQRKVDHSMCRSNWFIWIKHPKKSFNQTIILFDANCITCIEITSTQFETLKELFIFFQNVVWILCMWCSKNPLLWFWNNMIIVCLSWQNGFKKLFNIVCTNHTSSMIKLYSSLISDKPYFRVWNVQTVLGSFQTVDTLLMTIKLYSRNESFCKIKYSLKCLQTVFHMSGKLYFLACIFVMLCVACCRIW